MPGLLASLKKLKIFKIQAEMSAMEESFKELEGFELQVEPINVSSKVENEAEVRVVNEEQKVIHRYEIIFKVYKFRKPKNPMRRRIFSHLSK